jgi:hypothetical protein
LDNLIHTAYNTPVILPKNPDTRIKVEVTGDAKRAKAINRGSNAVSRRIVVNERTTVVRFKGSFVLLSECSLIKPCLFLFNLYRVPDISRTP